MVDGFRVRDLSLNISFIRDKFLPGMTGIRDRCWRKLPERCYNQEKPDYSSSESSSGFGVSDSL